MAAKKGLGTGLDILFGESTRAEEEHDSIIRKCVMHFIREMPQS